MESVRQVLLSDGAENLRQKLVSHRGWHRLRDDDDQRPLENTRQAYLDARDLGVPFSECDVWNTKDNQIVLSHDAILGRVAQFEESSLATTPLSELQWDDLRTCKLKDGSHPVLLSTVLQDLCSTGAKLLIEMKCSDVGKPLGEFIASNLHLVSSIACVISFSIRALEEFHDAYSSYIADKGQTDDAQISLLWLVDNPSTPYDYLNEGELTFDYTQESITDFVSKNDVCERVKYLRCGLHMQYNPALKPSHLRAVRKSLATIHGEHRPVMLGLWSDAELDPDFDSPSSLLEVANEVEFLNTDFASPAWGSEVN